MKKHTTISRNVTKQLCVHSNQVQTVYQLILVLSNQIVLGKFAFVIIPNCAVYSAT